MSIAVIIGVHDGIVLAADSASTVSISVSPATTAGVANVYDNANKIFNLYKGKPIGCVTFGSGSIGNSSIGTLIKDLRVLLSNRTKDAPPGISFDPDNYTMEDVSNAVGHFLELECAEQSAVAQANINIGILLGGYATGKSLGESWAVEIKAGKAIAAKQLRSPDQAGISWGGVSESIQRLVLGFSPQIFQVLADVSGAGGKPASTAQQIYDQLNPLLMSKLQAPLVFTPMPIQDAIDLGRFLVHTATMFSRFLPGPQIVGGPIEVAAITKHEGFKWISRKHYYDQSLNKEPLHVIVDQP